VKKAYNTTLAKHSVTVSLEGNRPVRGIAFSPYKSAEVVVPKEQFNEDTIGKYVEKLS